jgi:hypothetical protein
MFDVFVADLRCPGCNAVASVADNTGMQTHLRVEADGSALGVGFEFDPNDLKPERIVRSGYLLVMPPTPGKPIRLLEVWTCPTCQTEQWAMVTIDQERIQLIEAVKLDSAALHSANFVSETNAELLAERFSDKGSDVVETLRRNLP